MNSSAYLVQNKVDGKVKVINRLDLRVFHVGNEVPNVPQNELPMHKSSSEDEKSDSDSDDEILFFSPQEEERQPDLDPDLELGTEPRTRRSGRATAGKHSNPFNLPRSALQQEVNDVSFTDYSKAMLDLGLGFGKLLKDSYNQS